MKEKNEIKYVILFLLSYIHTPNTIGKGDDKGLSKIMLETPSETRGRDIKIAATNT